MALRVTYSNRYQLWSDLVRGTSDRLFIPVSAPPTLGALVTIEIRIADLDLRLTLAAEVAARRQGSRRFPPGVFVRLPASELDKCRRLLGLQTASRTFPRVRRAARVHHALPVRIFNPRLDQSCRTVNLSEGGLLVSGARGLLAGERVAVVLQLDGGGLDIEAEVAWASDERQLAGLQLLDPPAEVAAALRTAIEALLAAQARAASRPKPILVADDDREVLNFVTAALSRDGFQVFKAQTGEEALRLLRDLHPRLVLLDILMPAIDGAELCKVAGADAELAEIPIIFLSALDPETLHAVADECGATDYLPKPVHVNELLELVTYYLDATRRDAAPS